MFRKAIKDYSRSSQRQMIGFFLFMGLFILFAVVVAMFYLPNGGRLYVDDSSVKKWNQNWFVVTENKIEPVTLPIKVSAAAGEEVVFQKELPKVLEEGAAFCFRSYEQAVTVAVDGAVIYRYQGNASEWNGKSTATAWNFVSLQKENAGKLLTVTLMSPYPHFSGYFGDVSFGKEQSLLLTVTHEHFFEYVISAVLMAVGAFLILFSLYLLGRRYPHTDMTYLGIFLLIAAVWLLVNTHVPAILWLNYAQEDMLSHLALILLPASFVLYYKTTVLPCFDRWFNGLFWASILVGVIQLISQLTMVLDFFETQFLSVILILAILVFVLVELMIKLRMDHGHRFTLLAVGTLALICSIVLEILGSVCYWYQGFIHEGTLVSFGLFLFTTCILCWDIAHWVVEAHRAVDLDREVADNRFYLMTEQMKPHFLYNTLQAIQELCYSNPHQAADAIVTLSNYLRLNIDSLNKGKTIRFEKELEYIDIFMEIEKLRFGEKISFIKDIETTDFLLPDLTVQPLIENAVHHGLRKKKSGGTVCLSVRQEQELIYITIRDDGVGFDEKTAKPRSLTNIAHRLQSWGATLTVDSALNRGTTVTITLTGGEKDESLNC